MQEHGIGETMDTEPQPSDNGVFMLGKVEDGFNAAGSWTWEFFHNLPGHGAVIGGAVGLGAAMLFGVAELVTACFTAYVSYRMFAYGESLIEACENVIKFEEGKLDKEEIAKPILK